MRYLQRYWGLCLVLILALVCIFYKFTLIPDRLAHDEVEFARLALSLDHRPYTPFSPLADGHGTVYFYILLASLKLLGVTLFGLRLPSALFGLASVGLFYLLIGQFFEKKSYIPLLTSLLFLTSHWFLNFARFSFEMPYLLFLELTSLIFFCMSSSDKDRRDADPGIQHSHKSDSIPSWISGSSPKMTGPLVILSGIFAGLAFNSYQPGRIFFLLPLLILILKKVPARQILLYLCSFIIVIVPMTLHLYHHPEGDIRIGQQLYFKNTELSPQEKLGFLGQNIYKTGAMLFTQGDLNGRHNYPGKPAINPILGALGIVGIFVGLRKWREFPNQLFLAYLAIAIAPTLLTYPWENPNMLRTYTALPALFYFIGLALYEGIERGKKYALPIVILLVLLSSAYELRTYFKYQVQVFPHAFERGKNLQTELDLYQKSPKQYLKKIGR